MPARSVLVLSLIAAVVSSAARASESEARGRCNDQRPWCDTTLDPDRRAGLLVDAMTLDERLALLAGTQTPNFNARMAGVPRLGFPGFLIADGPAGISRPDDGTGLTQPARSEALALPAPIALAASFDTAAARRYGATAAAEARDRGVDILLGPAMDLVRTPLAGRGFETVSGEDPLLGARLGAAWIRGAQARGVVATAKHYVAYNQETDRYGPGAVNAVVDERTLRELYLPAFEAAVDAGVGTVMSSYNRINGRYADESHRLLREILKREWGFRGAVISDFSLGTHGTTSSLRAGLDVELPGADLFAAAKVRAAIAAGRLRTADVDGAVRRILRTLFAFGVPDRAAFANSGPRATPAARRSAARELAERGIVLLRNRARALPLDGGRRLRSLAVIGSAASLYESGGGSSNVSPPASVTPLEGLVRRAGGGVRVRAAGDDPAAAAEAARGADAAVVVLADDSSEFEDKTGISLADGDPACTGAGFGACGAAPVGEHEALVRAVAAANPRTIVVLETGGPVLLPWADDVEAIVEAWYPGQQGGDAIARVLFGDADPAGRLPQTFPRRIEDLAVRSAAQYPGVRAPGEAFPTARYSERLEVGYRHADARGLRPAYPFGHGLSYTSFAFRDLRVTRSSDGGLRASVVIANTGRRPGDAAPQLYLGVPDRPGVPQPPRRLAAFARVALRPGAVRRVAFRLNRRALSSWDVRRDRWAVVRGCHLVGVGASSGDLRVVRRVPVAIRRCRPAPR
jgi:beta-glucosidase